MKSRPKVQPTPTAKAPTGISGLDEITGGGLQRGTGTLVEGGAGSGKTVFALQSLVNGAREFNEPGIFVAFEEGPQNLVANASTFGWDIQTLQDKKLLFVDARPPFDLVQSGSFARRNNFENTHRFFVVSYNGGDHRAQAQFTSCVAGSRIRFCIASEKQHRWFRLLVSPVDHESSGGAVVAHIDITERKLLEESSTQRSIRLAALLEAQRLISAIEAIEEFIDRVVEAAQRLTDAPNEFCCRRFSFAYLFQASLTETIAPSLSRSAMCAGNAFRIDDC